MYAIENPHGRPGAHGSPYRPMVWGVVAGETFVFCALQDAADVHEPGIRLPVVIPPRRHDIVFPLWIHTEVVDTQPMHDASVLGKPVISQQPDTLPVESERSGPERVAPIPDGDVHAAGLRAAIGVGQRGVDEGDVTSAGIALDPITVLALIRGHLVAIPKDGVRAYGTAYDYSSRDGNNPARDRGRG